LLSLYHDDLPAQTSLDTEFHGWGVKWSDPEVLEEAKGINNPQKTLGTIIDGDFFPNIKRLITISCTFAVTSAECERSISYL